MLMNLGIRQRNGKSICRMNVLSKENTGKRGPKAARPPQGAVNVRSSAKPRGERATLLTLLCHSSISLRNILVWENQVMWHLCLSGNQVMNTFSMLHNRFGLSKAGIDKGKDKYHSDPHLESWIAVRQWKGTCDTYPRGNVWFSVLVDNDSL